MKLDIPPLEPVPHDHVLTRTFYLLQDFPGRWANSPVWVEASPEAEEVEGMPFRNLNDGVTPVVIGGNDWASAWAVQDSGAPMFPVGPRHRRRAAARDGAAVRGEPDHVRDDRQLQIRPGARAGAARSAGAVDAGDRLLAAAAAAADRRSGGVGAGRGGAGALARADRLVAARAGGAGAARGARRAVAPPRGPHAGLEHRHRGDRRQRVQPHRRPRGAGRGGDRRAGGAAGAAGPRRQARGPHRACRGQRRGRDAAPHRAGRGDGGAAGGPDRRGDPRDRRRGARPDGGGELSRRRCRCC